MPRQTNRTARIEARISPEAACRAASTTKLLTLRPWISAARLTTTSAPSPVATKRNRPRRERN